MPRELTEAGLIKTVAAAHRIVMRALPIQQGDETGHTLETMQAADEHRPLAFQAVLKELLVYELEGLD